MTTGKEKRPVAKWDGIPQACPDSSRIARPARRAALNATRPAPISLVVTRSSTSAGCVSATRLDNMTTSDRVKLCAIEVDIALSQNPKVKGMYSNEYNCEVMAYFREHKIEVKNASRNTQQEIRSIELTGYAVSLWTFCDDYLSDDADRGVYKLLYRS